MSRFLCKSEKQFQGFTLVELLVVIAVIGILTALVVPSLRSGEQQLALENSAHKLAQNVRVAMSLSLQAQPFTGGSCTNFEGYGIHFDRDSPYCYLIYANCGGNENYQGPTCGGVGGGADLARTIVELEPGVRIRSITPQQSNELSIFFLPPNPEVFLNRVQNEDAIIILELENDPSQTKTVTVNRKGIIDVD